MRQTLKPKAVTPTAAVPPFGPVDVPNGHPLWLVHTLTAKYGMKTLPARFLTDALGVPLHNRLVGDRLAECGLVLLVASHTVVTLHAASRELAQVVNETRFRERGNPLPRRRLVDIALGSEAAEADDEQRLRLAIGRYTQYRTWGIRLVRAEPISLRSPWRFLPGGELLIERFR